VTKHLAAATDLTFTFTFTFTFTIVRHASQAATFSPRHERPGIGTGKRRLSTYLASQAPTPVSARVDCLQHFAKPCQALGRCVLVRRSAKIGGGQVSIAKLTTVSQWL
jgi:hypothetical protein